MRIKLCVTKQSPTPTPILTKPIRGHGGGSPGPLKGMFLFLNDVTEWTASVSESVLFQLHSPPGLRPNSSCFRHAIIGETLIGACVFKITAPPFFLAEKKPELLKMHWRSRTPIFLVGTFLINKYFLTPNSEFWPVRALGTRPLSQ